MEQNTIKAEQSNVKVLDLLIRWVNQRPGLDYSNYGDPTSYRSEMREITKDRSDFYELLGLASRRCNNLEAEVTRILSKTSDRLTLSDDQTRLQYTTGQYFPTEYRPAASRVLKTIIWNSYRDEKDSNGTEVYSDGHQIRKAIKNNLSRRCYNNYFS